MDTPDGLAPYHVNESLSKGLFSLTGLYGEHVGIKTTDGTFYGASNRVLDGVEHFLNAWQFAYEQHGQASERGAVVRVEIFSYYDGKLARNIHGLVVFNTRAAPLLYLPDARLDTSATVTFTTELLVRIGIPPSVIGDTAKKTLATNHIVIFSREAHKRELLIGPGLVIPDGTPTSWRRILIKL